VYKSTIYKEKEVFLNGKEQKIITRKRVNLIMTTQYKIANLYFVVYGVSN